MAFIAVLYSMSSFAWVENAGQQDGWAGFRHEERREAAQQGGYGWQPCFCSSVQPVRLVLHGWPGTSPSGYVVTRVLVPVNSTSHVEGQDVPYRKENPFVL